MTKRENTLTINGMITEKLPNNMYRVKLENPEKTIIAHGSGKMKIMKIKVTIGDKVKVEISPPFDKGRIIARL